MRYLLAFLLVIPTAVLALDYRLENDNTVVLSGSIDEDDLHILPNYVTPNIRTVIFNDIDGGDATTTLELLPLLESVPRLHIVKGYCSSSCTLMFLAGQTRKLDGYLGFHSVYSYDTHKIHPTLSKVFNDYVAGRLGPQYDSKLFDFVFAKITSSNDFLIFSGQRNGVLCIANKCSNKTTKTAFDLGLVTIR